MREVDYHLIRALIRSIWIWMGAAILLIIAHFEHPTWWVGGFLGVAWIPTIIGSLLGSYSFLTVYIWIDTKKERKGKDD